MIKRSIRTRWTISLIFLALLPLTVLGIIVSWKSYTVQIQLTDKYQHEVAQHALSHFENFIHELESILKMAIKISDLSSISYQAKSETLAKILAIGDKKHVNLIEELSFIDATGMERVRVDRKTVYTKNEMRELSGAKVFQEPMRSGEIYYSSVLISEKTGEPFFVMAIPVVDMKSGKAAGVLLARIRMNVIWDMLTNIQVGKGGQAYIVDSLGRVVAHRNRSLALKGASIGLSDKECSIEKGLAGKYVLRACEPFYLGHNRMRLVTDMPLFEALGPTLKLIETMFFLLVITIIGALFLGYIVQRDVIRPVEKLAKTAKAITDGDLDQRAEVNHEDEIGSLATAFNIMATRLIDTIDSLLEEIKVRKQIEEELKEHRNDLAEIVDEATRPERWVRVDLELRSPKGNPALGKWNELRNSVAHDEHSGVQQFRPVYIFQPECCGFPSTAIESTLFHSEVGER